MTASPLLLHYADQVALLEDDRVVAVGRHDELLAGEPRYRRVVNRAMDEDDESAATGAGDGAGAGGQNDGDQRVRVDEPVLAGERDGGER
jgi:hypothetical protein